MFWGSFEHLTSNNISRRFAILFHWLSKDANVLHCNTIHLTSNTKIYMDSNQRQDKECVKNSIWCWRHQTTEGCSWSTLRTAGSSPPGRTWDSSPGSSGGHRRWRIWGKHFIFHHEIYSRVLVLAFSKRSARNVWSHTWGRGRAWSCESPLAGTWAPCRRPGRSCWPGRGCPPPARPPD